jgi:hypothetical protein
MNTGEGALSPYHLEGEADIVFQIGTAKFGVRDEDGNLDDDRLRAIAAHTQVKMFEIKLAQGAKPGKGASCPPPRSPTRSPGSGACPRVRTGSARTGTARRATTRSFST